ncbi:MAG: helix-turn-helix transcriptional regulator [Pseudomonadota bacterium]
MTFDAHTLLAATVAATLSVSTLAALLNWSQRQINPSRAILALFFAVFAFSEVDSVTAVLIQTPQIIRAGSEFAGFAANFWLGPLFFVYVRDIAGMRHTKSDRWTTCAHFIVPGAASVFAIGAFGLVEFTPGGRNAGDLTGLETLALISVHYGFMFLSIALAVQWVVYVVWVLYMQAKHVERLKQYYASTEGMELRWVSILACALGIYVLQHLVGQVMILQRGQDLVGPLFDSFLVLVVVMALALWSLRPSPDLEKATRALAEIEPPKDKKYEKSALNAAQADRIARKLVRAMEQDCLYRDPNLTLGLLAQHVGVSLNHVSQTLNQHLGQSFFEFVNSWRIKEAMPLVAKGDATILAIAYEVGFNSRSAFYSAFKRETGQTPTSFKSAKAGS